MRVLFARVGYMKFYGGPKPGDEKPIGGGKYNNNDIGHEAYNYVNNNGILYGYFQPHMKEPYEISLERIEKGYNGNKLDNVLVIWFATNPIDRGQVVLGWYNNATVFRSMQRPTNQPLRNNCNYNVRALKKDCVLLPISKRVFPVGHNFEEKKGNPGQANAFYILDQHGNRKDSGILCNQWIDNVISYVTSYDGNKISTRDDEIQEDITTAEHSSGGQGFQSDIEVRLMIESHAMKICKSFYEDKGFIVVDKSKTKPYDFEISKDGITKFVEVKGTQTDGNFIILTRNEVDLSNNIGSNMILFQVHSIVMNKKELLSHPSKNPLDELLNQ